MTTIIDTPVTDKCWNLYDSYGEICVHCGCCSKDPLTRANARYELCLEQIAHFNAFDGWDEDPEIRALQERNIKHDLKYFNERLRYYKKRLEEVKKCRDGEKCKTQATPVHT